MVSRLSSFLALCLLGCLLSPARAQTLLSCTERPHWTFEIRARPEVYCVEIVIDDESAGEMGFTGLAFAPDGRLFAARPLQGQVLMLHDTDGDTQPDSPQIIADGLDRPNALLYYDNALYIAGGASVYRLPDNGKIETLTDDLPSNTGLWNGGLTSDGTWLYVGVGAACEDCEPDPRQGSIVRLPLVGGADEIYAWGFRQPLALLWSDNTLWATDSARPLWEKPQKALDELNHVERGYSYGYPNCLGLTRAPDPTHKSDINCEDTTAPILGLPTLSQPGAIALYRGDAFPDLQGKLLMAFMGSTNRSDVRGYGLVAFDFPPPEPPFAIEVILPFDASITGGTESEYTDIGLISLGDMSFLNRRGVGLWPHHLYGLAVSPQGWIYMSVGGGRILSLRPR